MGKLDYVKSVRLSEQEVSEYQEYARSLIRGFFHLEKGGKSDGWRHHWTRGGVTCSTKYEDDSPILIIKGSGIMQGDLDWVFEGFTAVDTTEKLRQEMAISDPMCNGAAMLATHRIDESNVFFLTWLSFCASGTPVWDRDFCLANFMTKTYDEDDQHRAVVVMATSIERPEVPEMPKKESTIRGETITSGYVFRETSTPGELAITYIVQADIKGSIPLWVANRINMDQAKNVGRTRDRLHEVQEAMRKMGLDSDSKEIISAQMLRGYKSIKQVKLRPFGEKFSQSNVSVRTSYGRRSESFMNLGLPLPKGEALPIKITVAANQPLDFKIRSVEGCQVELTGGGQERYLDRYSRIGAWAVLTVDLQLSPPQPGISGQGPTGGAIMLSFKCTTMVKSTMVYFKLDCDRAGGGHSPEKLEAAEEAADQHHLEEALRGLGAQEVNSPPVSREDSFGTSSTPPMEAFEVSDQNIMWKEEKSKDAMDVATDSPLQSHRSETAVVDSFWARFPLCCGVVIK